MGDDLCVPGVGGLGAEHDGGPSRHPEDLVQEGQLELAVPLAPQFRPEMGGPQILVPHLLLHRVDDGPQLVVQWVELPVGIEDVERLDLVLHELTRPVQLLLELGLG